MRTARHALAIDEHREIFDASLWQANEWTDSEQRWLPGAHGDIGGGYESDTENGTMSNIAGDWIITEAKSADMYVPRAFFRVLGDKTTRLRNGRYISTAITADVHDPSTSGVWKHMRKIDRKMGGRGNGDERVAPLARERYKERKDYKPKNFKRSLGMVSREGFFSSDQQDRNVRARRTPAP